MMRVAILLLMVFTAITSSAQKVVNHERLTADTAYDNVHVIPFESTKDASSFIIFVKDEVPPHRHLEHTEHVYVIEGEGIMYFNGKFKNIKPGDVISIPPKTVHAVQTTSSTPLKVLSVQAPEFKGNDRETVETEDWPPRIITD